MMETIVTLTINRQGVMGLVKGDRNLLENQKNVKFCSLFLKLTQT